MVEPPLAVAAAVPRKAWIENRFTALERRRSIHDVTRTLALLGVVFVATDGVR